MNESIQHVVDAAGTIFHVCQRLESDLESLDVNFFQTQ